MYKEGRYVYYTISEAGLSESIIRYDIKTGKKKNIKSPLRNNGNIQVFSCVSVKGKYIYCTWNWNCGFSSNREYIYKISKNGKKVKRLACGDNPVIKGKRIYYNQHKLINKNGEKQTEPTGKIYSMKLDGTDKREERNFKYKIRVGGGYDNNSIVKGKYKYYIGKNGRTLYRKNIKTNRKKKLISFKNNLTRFCISENYLQVIGCGNDFKTQAYLLKTNGKGKVKLQEWDSVNL